MLPHFMNEIGKKKAGRGKSGLMHACVHAHTPSLAAVAVLPPSRVKVESSCVSKMW